jgi:hypothetical protein
MPISMQQRFGSTPFSRVFLFLLICFAVPSLVDVAFCDELDGTRTSPSQAALVDGEPDERWNADAHSVSFDGGPSTELRLWSVFPGFAVQHCFDNWNVRSASLRILASRAPPLP